MGSALLTETLKSFTHNLKISDQTQISHVSVQSKLFSIHPSTETPERKRFSSKFDPQFYSYWEYMDVHGSKCFIFRI